jgi:hypothetical protein
VVVRGEGAMEGEELGEDGFEGGVGFHRDSSVMGYTILKEFSLNFIRSFKEFWR